jgi:hypothetical protein
MSDETESPTSKAELLERMRTGRAEWDALIGQIPETAMTQPVMNDSWSVKDLIAHVAAYENWTAAQLRAANENRVPTDMELYGVEQLPPDPEGWDLDRQNAAIYWRYREMPLSEVQAFSARAYDDLIAAVERTPEDELAKPGTPTWVIDTSLLAVIPGQSYAHYEQHFDELRAIAGADTY